MRVNCWSCHWLHYCQRFKHWDPAVFLLLLFFLGMQQLMVTHQKYLTWMLFRSKVLNTSGWTHNVKCNAFSRGISFQALITLNIRYMLYGGLIVSRTVICLKEYFCLSILNNIYWVKCVLPFLVHSTFASAITEND